MDVSIDKKAHTEKNGTIIDNSDFLTNLSYKDAMKKIIQVLEEKGYGKGTINYRLRDAILVDKDIGVNLFQFIIKIIYLTH